MRIRETAKVKSSNEHVAIELKDYLSPTTRCDVFFSTTCRKKNTQSQNWLLRHLSADLPLWLWTDVIALTAPISIDRKSTRGTEATRREETDVPRSFSSNSATGNLCGSYILERNYFDPREIESGRKGRKIARSHRTDLVSNIYCAF